MGVREQLEGIDPSVPDALFRRLLYEEELGYLREENTIVGFEVDLDQSVDLLGYALIAIQKHTILAFRSDLDEPYKLILFPSMDKLDDQSFGLQQLTVKRKIFSNDTFEGKLEKEGFLQTVASDLIPPYKEVEVDDDMAKAMRSSVKEETLQRPKSKPKKVSLDPDPQPIASTHAPIDDEGKDFPQEFEESAPVEPPEGFDDAPVESPFDDSPFDDAPAPEPDFDDEPDFDEPDDAFEPDEPVEESKEDERVTKLNAQTFEKLHEVEDYVTVYLNIPREYAKEIANASLNAGVSDRKKQIQIAVGLFVKLIKAGKV